MWYSELCWIYVIKNTDQTKYIWSSTLPWCFWMSCIKQFDIVQSIKSNFHLLFFSFFFFQMICWELKPNIRRYAIKPAFKTSLFLVFLNITSCISRLCPIPLVSMGMERFRLDKNLIWHINHVFLPQTKHLRSFPFPQYTWALTGM